MARGWPSPSLTEKRAPRSPRDARENPSGGRTRGRSCRRRSPSSSFLAHRSDGRPVIPAQASLEAAATEGVGPDGRGRGGLVQRELPTQPVLDHRLQGGPATRREPFGSSQESVSNIDRRFHMGQPYHGYGPP